MSKPIRKWIFLTLCLVIILTAVISPAYAERTINIRKAVAEGGDTALWELVNSHFSTNVFQEEGCADLFIWQPDGPSFPAAYSDDRPLMNLYTIKMQETAGIGFLLEQILIYQVSANGNCYEDDISAYYLPNGPVYIDPYESFSFKAGNPAGGSGRYLVIAAIGTDDNGHQLEFYGVLQRLNTLPEVVAENPRYDTVNLRYEAAYEEEVADGVWWVPVRTLGDSRYTNREIAAIAQDCNPEEKQQKISTLYEAIQLFQISNFSTSMDNVRIREGNINWEHHKPGYHAVRTNTGCCAAVTSWLNYILSGDYEQTGQFSYSYPDGNGHVFNYIFQDGYYYFIDLTYFQTDFTDTRTESGSLSEYRNSAFISSYLHKAISPEAYVNYIVSSWDNPPPRFFIHEAQDVPPGDGLQVEGRMTAVYPEGCNIRIIDGKRPQKLDVQFVTAPEKTPNWDTRSTAKIRTDSKYTSEEYPADEPLTPYHPGDILSLADQSQSGSAVIDGTIYNLSSKDDICLVFETAIILKGEYTFNQYELSFFPGLCSEALKDMDSLKIGELIAEIYRNRSETQIIICIRDGDHLVVQEVMNGKYYDSRAVGIRRDENGNWLETPEYWYLLITKDKTIDYYFARFHCGISDV